MELKKCGGYKGKCYHSEDMMVPVSNFTKSSKSPDGLQFMCSTCRVEQHKDADPKSNAISREAYKRCGGKKQYFAMSKAERLALRAEIKLGGQDSPSNKEKPTLTLVKNNPPKPAAQPMRKRVGGTMEGEVVPQGWVYMIGNPEIPHLLKIGRTYPDGIDSRLSEAQRWGRAELVGKFWFDDVDEAEKRIHAMLYKWNLRTMGYNDCGKELFHVSTSMVEEVVKEYTKELESSENAVG